jgi:hypothetical protein
MPKGTPKLPRVIGILADPNYEQRAWIYNLILEAEPNAVIVTAETPKIDGFIEKIAILKEDTFYKCFESDPWEQSAFSPSKAERTRDFLFLSYVRLHKGRVFFFPVMYDTTEYGMKYSRRMQEVIVMAHQLRVPYEVIRVGEDGYDFSTGY